MSNVIHLGSMAIREHALTRECDENRGHLHNFDHTTFVQEGSVKVFYRKMANGREYESRVFKVGEFFEVKAEIYHRIKAVGGGARYACVFAYRDADTGMVVQEYNGYDAAFDLKPDPVEEAAGV